MKKYIFKEKFELFDFINIHNKPKNIYEIKRKMQSLSKIWYISVYLIGFIGAFSYPFFDKTTTNNLQQNNITEIKTKSSNINNNKVFTNIDTKKIDTIDLIMSDPVKEERNYLKKYIN